RNDASSRVVGIDDNDNIGVLALSEIPHHRNAMALAQPAGLMLLIAGPENYYVRLRDEPGKKLDQRLCPGCGGDHLAIGNAIPERCSSQQSLLFSARRQARPDTRRQFGNREG